MSEPKSPVTLTQIAASALAASSAAFAASYLGVAGTIIGAAVASVIATVASAMYGASLDRSAAAVRRTTSQLVRAPGHGAAPAPLSPLRPAAAPVAPELEQTRVLVVAPERPRLAPAVRTPQRWTRTALAAAAVLGITLASVTGLEAVLGKPLSGFLGGTGTSGTTLGSAVSADHPSSTPEAEPDPVAEPTPTPSPAPTATPTDEPTPAAPTTEEPDPGTTAEPTPEPTPLPDPTPTAPAPAG